MFEALLVGLTKAVFEILRLYGAFLVLVQVGVSPDHLLVALREDVPELIELLI